ncbi:MAG: response regulator [Thermoanaerobaculia bacterium]
MEIESATTLADGLVRLAEGFDAVLVDLGLPDSQGLDTVARIRFRFPDIPLVVLTSNDDVELGVSAVQAAASCPGPDTRPILPQGRRQHVPRRNPRLPHSR